MRAAWVLAVGAIGLLAAGCSSDDGAEVGAPTSAVTTAGPTTTAPASTLAPTTTATSTTTSVAEPTTTVAPTTAPYTPTTVDPALPVEQQIAAAVRAYDEAYLAAGSVPVNPDHPAIIATTTDGAFRFGIQQSLQELKNLGYALQPGPEAERVLTSVTVRGSAAEFTYCRVDDGTVYVVATGAVVNDERAVTSGRGSAARSAAGDWLVENLLELSAVVSGEAQC